MTRVATTTEIASLGFGAVIEGERGERHMVIHQGVRSDGVFRGFCLRADDHDPGYTPSFRSGDVEVMLSRWPRVIVEP